MSYTKVTIPKNWHGIGSVSDGSGFAPAIIEFGYWSTSQLSIAKFYGGLVINGHEYKLLDSGEAAAPGLYKPDLVRADWCSLYKRYRRGLRDYIRKGMTPSQVRKLLKAQKGDDKNTLPNL